MRRALPLGLLAACTGPAPCEPPSPCAGPVTLELPMDWSFMDEVEVLHIAPLHNETMGRYQAIRVQGTSVQPTVSSFALLLEDDTTVERVPSEVAVLEEGEESCSWLLMAVVEPLDLAQHEGELAQLTVILDVATVTRTVRLDTHLD
jgi:hypothetical protein